jgi:hypothetical protein
LTSRKFPDGSRKDGYRCFRSPIDDADDDWPLAGVRAGFARGGVGDVFAEMAPRPICSRSTA